MFCFEENLNKKKLKKIQFRQILLKMYKFKSEISVKNYFKFFLHFFYFNKFTIQKIATTCPPDQQQPSTGTLIYDIKLILIQQKKSYNF